MVSYEKSAVTRHSATTVPNKRITTKAFNSTGRSISFKDTNDMCTATSRTMGSSCFKAHSKFNNPKMKRRLLLSEPTLSSVFDDSYNSPTKSQLEQISDWGFDIFSLDKASKGQAMFHVVLKLFQTHDLINKFNIDVRKLMDFTTLVEEGYQSNPYHNALHAADVAQAMHCYITQGKIQRTITPVEELVAIIAAITHDLDHPGVNQNYLIATNNHLASLYNNVAVLENHHFKKAVEALHQSELLDHLLPTLREQIELEIKSLILATDMSRQQEFFNILKQRVDENSIDLTNYEDRHFVMQVALKCADISNPCRHWSACKNWSKKICEEFFRQGDYEKELSLPVSNLCDRQQHTVPKIQTGFIDFVVKPLFTLFEKLMFPDRVLSEQLDNLAENRTTWQEKIDNNTLVNTTQRPKSLPLSSLDALNNNTEVPSPTGSIENQSESEDDLMDQSEHEHFSRRHSMPVLELLARKELLHYRRQSFPDAKLRTRVSQKLYQSFLLDQVVGCTNDIKSSINRRRLASSHRLTRPCL